MELDIFITETLKSVIKGIKESQDFAKENGARINPHLHSSNILNSQQITFYGREEGARLLSEINFDIAISSSNEQENGLKGGINVLSVNFGGNLSDKDSKETVSRIKFSVNVAFPNVVP
jgi:hypothetical protein